MLTIFSQTNVFEPPVPKDQVRPGAASQIGRAMPCSSMNGRSVWQAGFSLIELMIALTIGLIIALAIAVIFSQVSSGFRSTDDGTRATENGNFALRTIGEDLRMVGFVGLFNDPVRLELATTDMIATAATDNCGNQQWPWPNTNPGIEHVADPGSLPCIPAGSYLNTSPAIVVRHASGIKMLPPFDLSANDNLFLQSGPLGGILFRGANYAADVLGAGRHVSMGGSEAPIFQYLVYIYYVRPCSRPVGIACAATDDGGQPVPTLVRRQLDGGVPARFIETPIAEGVERLSVAYGIDDIGNDGVPDRYVPAPTAAELSQAKTARISVLMRTRKLEGSHDDSRFTYTLADGTRFNCATDLAPCQYRRYLLNDTVVLKNYAYQN